HANPLPAMRGDGASGSEAGEGPPSLIDRRRGIHEQRDDVADLLFGQDVVVTEARHVRARRKRFGVVDLLPRVATCFVGVAAILAEPIERRADRPVRKLLRRQLVACITIRAGGLLRVVGVLEALPALRDLLAALPVADEIAVGRIADRVEIGLLDALGGGRRQRALRVFAADALRFILVETRERRLTVRLER